MPPRTRRGTTTAPRGRFAPDPTRPDTTLTDINSYGIRDAARDPDAAGKYDHTIGVVDLNVEYRF